jgi:tRNA (mo5U34)-methyltransferase
MSAKPPTSSDLRTEAERYGWYHTLDLGSGVVTKGMFDHRPYLRHYPIPADLAGRHCLDVATMDGFWAFELERRGAARVIALDIEDPAALDWPASLRATHDRGLDETKRERFELARRALGSSAERVPLSVYDLGPQLGSFDFVFCGDLLCHLKDPVTALENIRSVCSGSAVIVNPIRKFRFLERRPIAELDGMDIFEWWVTNYEGLVRMVRAAGFPRVDRCPTWGVPVTGTSSWKGLRGAVVAHAR